MTIILQRTGTIFFISKNDFGGTLGALLVEILLLLLLILQRTGTVLFISIQNMTFEALLGHFFGTFGGNSLIIINDKEEYDNTLEVRSLSFNLKS